MDQTGCVALPFPPVLLMGVPIDQILTGLKSLLF